MKRNKTYIDHLPLAALQIEPSAQRDLNQAWVRWLMANWDFDRMDEIEVSGRGGTYYIIDGQHRAEALRGMGHGHIKVPCVVRQGLAVEGEAERFLGRNTTRPPTPYDKFKVGLTAGDPVCHGIKAIVEAFDLKVSGSVGDGNVTAVSELQRLYKRDPEVLRQALELITESWGTQARAVERLILGGLGEVVGRYNGELDRSALVKKLSKYKGGPGGLAGDARQIASIRPVTATRAVAEQVVDLYNRGRRAGALPPL